MKIVSLILNLIFFPYANFRYFVINRKKKLIFTRLKNELDEEKRDKEITI